MPRMPALQPIISKHWRAMQAQDKYLNECFNKSPLTGFRRQANIRDILVKSKVPPPPKPYPERRKQGMTKCAKPCQSCPYVKFGKEINISHNKSWIINKKMTCESFNIIYMLECQKDNCWQRYIGETGRQLKQRIAEHRGYITNQILTKARTYQATAWLI